MIFFYFILKLIFQEISLYLPLILSLFSIIATISRSLRIISISILALHSSMLLYPFFSITYLIILCTILLLWRKICQNANNSHFRLNVSMELNIPMRKAWNLMTWDSFPTYSQIAKIKNIQIRPYLTQIRNMVFLVYLRFHTHPLNAKRETWKGEGEEREIQFLYESNLCITLSSHVANLCSLLPPWIPESCLFNILYTFIQRGTITRDVEKWGDKGRDERERGGEGEFNFCMKAIYALLYHIASPIFTLAIVNSGIMSRCLRGRWPQKCSNANHPYSCPPRIWFALLAMWTRNGEIWLDDDWSIVCGRRIFAVLPLCQSRGIDNTDIVRCEHNFRPDGTIFPIVSPPFPCPPLVFASAFHSQTPPSYRFFDLTLGPPLAINFYLANYDSFRVDSLRG